MNGRRHDPPRTLAVGPRMPDDVQAQASRLLSKAKPSTVAMFDPSTAVVLFCGQGKLDIGETVIAVPLASLLDLVGGLMQSVAAPALQGKVFAVAPPPSSPSAGTPP